MRVRGEAFLLVNLWMDYLSLLLAACLGRRRFAPGRAALSASLGTLYALLAWMGPSFLRSWQMAALAAFFMARIAFRRDALRLTPLILAGGWALGGGAQWLKKCGAGNGLILLFCALLTGLICLAARKTGAAGQGPITVRIAFKGVSVSLPGLRDSGNMLTEGAAGRPVIAASADLLAPLFPPGTDPKDLSTLPRGWHLIRLRTAAGEGTAMCFSPEEVTLGWGKKEWAADAAVAVTEGTGGYALVPEGLFRPRRGGKEEKVCGLIR